MSDTDHEMNINVDGEDLDMNRFTSDIVAAAVVAMVKQLKGGEDAKKITITIDVDEDEA